MSCAACVLIGWWAGLFIGFGLFLVVMLRADARRRRRT